MKLVDSRFSSDSAKNPVDSPVLLLPVCRYHNGDAYIIDVSQSVEHDHPHALEFLRKDCSNVNGENLLLSFSESITPVS